MAQDLDEMMQKAPTLTLDPFGEEKAAVAEKEPEPLVKEEEVISLRKRDAWWKNLRRRLICTVPI